MEWRSHNQREGSWQQLREKLRYGVGRQPCAHHFHSKMRKWRQRAMKPGVKFPHSQLETKSSHWMKRFGVPSSVG